MEILKSLNEGQGRKGAGLRKCVLSDKFEEYQKKLISIKKKEEELFKLDEEIYGTNSPLKVGYLTKGDIWHSDRNYGEFVIYPVSGKIAINRYLSDLYGNGGKLRESSIETHEYPLSSTCFANEMVLIALRRLKKAFNDKVDMEVKKIEKRNEERIKKRKPVNAFAVQEWYENNYFKIAKDSLHDRLFYAILENYDFISYYLNLEGKPIEDITGVYEEFMKILPIMKKISKMPSDSEFFTDLKKYSDVFSGIEVSKPSLETAQFVVSTILSEVKKSKEALSKHEEYEKMRAEFESAKKLFLSEESEIIRIISK
ncbi:MAG: hypothetical protein IJ809_03190 [Clostridia bacterium]|nr:hypothetical protein [Clostridia bacterium]